MKYYTASQTSRELGISSSELREMIRRNEIEAERRNSGTYRISEREIKRLAEKLERDEAELDREFENTSMQQGNRNVRYYSITEVTEKFGIERAEIMRLIKTGKIEAIKGEHIRSPYRIAETELQKFYDIPTDKKRQDRALSSEVATKPAHTPDKNYEDLLQIQKMLVETMRGLAATQEQIASTLRELVKKV